MFDCYVSLGLPPCSALPSPGYLSRRRRPSVSLPQPFNATHLPVGLACQVLHTSHRGRDLSLHIPRLQAGRSHSTRQLPRRAVGCHCSAKSAFARDSLEILLLLASKFKSP